MVTTQTPLSQFVVLRDNHLDPEYTGQLIASERQQALQEVAGQAITATKQHVLSLAKLAGTGALNALDQFIQSAS